MTLNCFPVSHHDASVTRISHSKHDARSLATTIVHGPYLQAAGKSSLIILWDMTTSDIGVVFVGTKSSSLGTRFSTTTASTSAAVRVTGLKSATRYYYSIGTPTTTLKSGSKYTFVTLPSLGTVKSMRALMLGDPGTLLPQQTSVINAARAFLSASKPADVWFMLGDNAYEDGTAIEYSTKVFQFYQDDLRSVPMWAIVGNHDSTSSVSKTGVEIGPHFSMFPSPRAGESGGVPSGSGTYFSVDYGVVHVVCLDSYMVDMSASGPMALCSGCSATWLH